MPNFLNEQLIASDQDHVAFIFPPNLLKEYITSLTEGFHIEGGNIIIVGKEENLLEISDLRISKSGIAVTLNLTLSNGKDGIRADITKFHRDVMARANKASSREEVEKQIEAIDSAIKKRFDEEIKAAFGWKTKKVSILDGKVRVEFEKH